MIAAASAFGDAGRYHYEVAILRRGLQARAHLLLHAVSRYWSYVDEPRAGRE